MNQQRQYPLNKRERRATKNFMDNYFKTTHEEDDEIKEKIGRELLNRIEDRLKQNITKFPFDSWESNYYYNGYVFICRR